MLQRLALVFALFVGWSLVETFVPATAQAAFSPKGKCKRAVRTWRKKPGNGAFAVDRSGRACGYSSGYPSRKAANRAALRQCRKLRRGCRVISTTKARRIVAKKQPRLRSDCKKSFNTWRKRDSFGAFALARDGSYCSAIWNAPNLEEARKEALLRCKAKSGCTVYRTNQPKNLKQARQGQLQELGFYKGKIDGAWGRGTQRAMREFVRAAGHKKTNDQTAWSLLKWATQIKREFDVEPQVAVRQAKRALDKKSTDFMALLAKRRNDGPETASLPKQQSEQQQTIENNEPSDRDLSNDVARQIGLVPASQWQGGKGVWRFSSTDQKVENANKIGRCRLSTGGIVFAHYKNPKIGTIAILHEPEFSPSEVQADWVFDDLSSFKTEVARLPEIGAYLKVPKPGVFFKALIKDETLGARGVSKSKSFDVSKIEPAARAFLECSRKVLLEPAAPAVAVKVPKPAANKGIAVATQDRYGQFVFLTQLDALPVPMLFDTGASYVTINESMASMLGVKIRPSDFKHVTNTANGKTKFAKTKIKEIRVGDVVVKNVEVAVLRDKSLQGYALLGMSFLRRIKRFEFEGTSLTLTR